MKKFLKIQFSESRQCVVSTHVEFVTASNLLEAALKHTDRDIMQDAIVLQTHTEYYGGPSIVPTPEQVVQIEDQFAAVRSEEDYVLFFDFGEKINDFYSPSPQGMRLNLRVPFDGLNVNFKAGDMDQSDLDRADVEVMHSGDDIVMWTCDGSLGEEDGWDHFTIWPQKVRGFV